MFTRRKRSIQGSGSVGSEMEMERRFGPMAPAMKVTGRITELMATENSLISMAMSTREIGSMIRPTARASTFT